MMYLQLEISSDAMNNFDYEIKGTLNCKFLLDSTSRKLKLMVKILF